MKQFILILSVLLVAGCQTTDPLSAEKDPRSDWWGLAFTEPDYMKVWVEDSSVLDINNRTFFKAGGSTAAGGEPEDGTESARGWGTVSGSGIPVTGADLPNSSSFVGSPYQSRRPIRVSLKFQNQRGS